MSRECSVWIGLLGVSRSLLTSFSIMLSSPSLEQEGSFRKERWYGTEYRVQRIDGLVIDVILTTAVRWIGLNGSRSGATQMKIGTPFIYQRQILI